jgi:hypothetical protein
MLKQKEKRGRRIRTGRGRRGRRRSLSLPGVNPDSQSLH